MALNGHHWRRVNIQYFQHFRLERFLHLPSAVTSTVDHPVGSPSLGAELTINGRSVKGFIVLQVTSNPLLLRNGGLK
jgi:hypothetical protein